MIRTDLKMSKGKVAAQAAHAAVSAQEIVRIKNQNIWKRWLHEGQKKVVLKVESEVELMKFFLDAQKLNIPVALIQDRGLTQIPPNTKTAIGIGPITTKDANLLKVNELKLL